jgi:hypothetical protein
VHRGHRAVELVIETATGLLTGRFGPREAVTILASQAPQARAEARLLAEHEPGWARAHAELLDSIRDALASKAELTAQARDLRAVLDDLDRVVAALTT